MTESTRFAAARIRCGARCPIKLTNGFSKKLEHHIAAVSLHFMYYNFVKTHSTIRMTPAMAAGVVSSPWEMSDVVKLMEASNTEHENRQRAERNERSYNPFGDALGHGPQNK